MKLFAESKLIQKQGFCTHKASYSQNQLKTRSTCISPQGDVNKEVVSMSLSQGEHLCVQGQYQE